MKGSLHKVALRRYVAAAVAALLLVVGLCSCGALEWQALFSEDSVSVPYPAADGQATTSGAQPYSSYSANGDRAASEAFEPDAYLGQDAYPASDFDAGYGDSYLDWCDPFNTEEYRSIHEGGFVAAATRPLSTFSADVDTASYCNLRRMIEDGYWAQDIPQGAIRIEEMLNYFTYDYALPQGTDLFGTTVQVANCPWNKDTKLAVFGFATSPEVQKHAGSNLVFLIDVSGSMNSLDKLDLLKDAFGVLVDGLDEHDRVSIVTYASGEDVVLDGARGSDRRKILRAVNRLHAEGATNGAAGLQMAYQVAAHNFIEDGVNRIILASDGDLNVGIVDESSLEAYVAKQRETGIYLSVLGFGSGNYKDNKMETLADAGNGNYHYIDCVAEAQRVFGENLTANLVPLADDVKLQVEFNPAQVKAYRLIGYENRTLADEDFRDDAKDAGDVGPGHQFSVAYELALADSDWGPSATDLKYSTTSAPDARDASGEWLTCTMRYRLAGSADYAEQQFVVDASSLTSQPSDDWRFAAAVIEAGMVLRESAYTGGADLDDVLELLEGIESPARGNRAEFYDLIDAIA